MSNKDLRFVLICLLLFMFGGLLRIQAGWITLPQQVEASSTFSRELTPEMSAELEQTVLKFYTMVDKGRYDEAYQFIFENKWQKLEDGAYAPNGLIGQDEFREVLSNEIGGNGMGLNIISIEVRGQSPLPPDRWTAREYPELQTLKSLPDDIQVQGVYEVEVGGVLLGRCSRWDWQDKVLVARLSGEKGWRLLLPGSPEPSSPHHEEWFLDRDPLKGKTIAGEEQQT